MAPLLKSVEKAGIKGVLAKRNPARIGPRDFFDLSHSLRKEISVTIHADDPNRIVIIPSVSYGMASVARNVRIEKHQHIIVAAEQFPSNYYCWKRICDDAGAALRSVAPPATLKDRGKIWNTSILEAIDENTRLVAIGHVHWADGTRFDLEAIRKRTREVGALLVIDGTQSVGALPFDLRRIDPDALVVAGYKWLLGPYSIGFAYFGKYFDEGIPLEESWMNRRDSDNFNSLVNYRDEYLETALRFEVGEHSNFILVPMLLKAVAQLNRWGIENIQEYCKAISSEAIDRLREYGYWIEDEKYRGSHLFGIRIPKEKNIEILKATLAKKNIFVSFRGDAIRVAPNVYNTHDDLSRLANALTSGK
jgi:selenocysteine lyase/cysteine desulfurase